MSWPATFWCSRASAAHTFHMRHGAGGLLPIKNWHLTALQTGMIQTTISHHETSSTIMNHHQPSLLINSSQVITVMITANSFVVSECYWLAPLTPHWPLPGSSPSPASFASGPILVAGKHPRRPWARKSRTCDRGPQWHTCPRPCRGCTGTSAGEAGRATQRFGRRCRT